MDFLLFSFFPPFFLFLFLLPPASNYLSIFLNQLESGQKHRLERKSYSGLVILFIKRLMKTIFKALEIEIAVIHSVGLSNANSPCGNSENMWRMIQGFVCTMWGITYCELCMRTEKEEFILRVRTGTENIYKSKDLSWGFKERGKT